MPRPKGSTNKLTTEVKEHNLINELDYKYRKVEPKWN